MNSIPRVPGIYQIRCIETGRVYIGGTSNLRKRWGYHRGELRRDTHTNAALQEGYNRLGLAAFVFEVLELTSEDREDILTREQYWLDRTEAYKPEYGYNGGPIARATYAGRKHTPEIRLKISRNRSKPAPLTPEQRARQIAAIRSPENREKLRLAGLGKTWPESRKRHYIVTDPYGNIYRTDNMMTFCLAHSLSDSNMRSVAHGKRPHHKGWTCRFEVSHDA